MKKLIQSALALAMAVLTFSSCEDVPMPFNFEYEEKPGEVTTVEPAGEGTEASPYNVAKVNEIIKAGTYTTDNVYIKGVITNIKEIDNTNHGNATYSIADTKDGKPSFLIYRGFYLNGAKFKTGDEIAVGDTVVVLGQLTNYNGTYETTKGSKIISINGKGNGGNQGSTAQPAGEGTAASPYNVAKAQSVIATLAADAPTAEVYISGIIVGTPDISTQYGNATYYISDDGSENGKLLVYRGYGFNGDKFTATDQLKAGDKVVISGKLINFKGNTPEVTMGSKLVSLNGNTNGSGTGETPGNTKPAGEGTAASPYNVAKAQSIIATLGADAPTEDVYIAGIIVGTPDINTQYGNATYYISDDGTEAGKLMVFRGYGFNGDKFTATDQLKAGDKVVILGKLINFKGNTPEVTMGSKLINLSGNTGGNNGGNTGGDNGNTSPGITVSGTTVTAVNSAVTAGTTTVTIDLSTIAQADATEATTYKLSDGSTITFGAGDNTTTIPKFYVKTKGVRLYANNTITFAGKANIAKIVFTCDSYNGTDYVGNPTQTIVFDGKNATYTNTHTAASGGTQLRVQTITITYAK